MGRITGLLAATLAWGTAATTEAKSAIVGGKSVGIQAAPWQLLLKAGGGTCGAAWLGGRWVATAAHCVEGASAGNTSVHAGITRYREATNANRLGVRRIVRNPRNSGISQDLALVELLADVTAPLAKPIRYATPADATGGLTNKGAWCMATGWGKLSPSRGLADSLQMVESRIHSTSNYVIRWAGQGGDEDIGSCQGDSGGPLVVKDAQGGFVLAGISSFVTSFCGDPDTPSGYARVSAIAYFIQEHVNPITTGLAEARPRLPAFAAPGRFRLDAEQALDLAWIDAAGAVVARESRRFPAGEHSLERPGLPAGVHAVRFRGPRGDAFHRILTGP